MNAAYGGHQTNSYLVQRINSASEEELAAMLLGGAERFLTQAVAAIGRKDYMEKARLLTRASKILERLLEMINADAEVSLVNRLRGLYIWWIKEMFEGSRYNRPEQIEAVVRQMATLRGAWEERSSRQLKLRPAPALPVEGLVG